MDARIKHSLRAIKAAFMELIKEKTVQKISVTEICQNAGVNRATFYKYFDGPEDLLSKLEVEQMEELSSKINKADPKDLRELVAVVIENIHENFEFYSLVFGKETKPKFVKIFMDTLYEYTMKFLEEAFPSTTDLKREYLYYFIMSGCMGVTTIWIAQGRKVPVETVHQFSLDIVDQMFTYGKLYK